jgi:hypothetical protein
VARAHVLDAKHLERLIAARVPMTPDHRDAHRDHRCEHEHENKDRQPKTRAAWLRKLGPELPGYARDDQALVTLVLRDPSEEEPNRLTPRPTGLTIASRRRFASQNTGGNAGSVP